jgi:hypothetical protein
MVFQIDTRVSLSLSTLMILFALYLPASKYLMPFILGKKEDAVFTSWRDESGEMFLAHRVENAPIHYLLLHIIPAYVPDLFTPCWPFLLTQSLHTLYDDPQHRLVLGHSFTVLGQPSKSKGKVSSDKRIRSLYMLFHFGNQWNPLCSSQPILV